ncbi:undecaprenyl-phosphate glucose phosphotransferase [Thiorhodococcus minor]|uniref:Undecaprenyl-phosphate glucose phosphotransferase n=1 Tax=Thiorhodococcus minor TaxID=57489 RepID=A0A6M0K3E8_9GAMM|nr:undecaprenyl-phosphate glucose phosphotransferase [Thiorhodococcus minor]NEV62845.1 undecaprenyl-phosphate glucose phosphotransferase [Thiorhodococcus minor]
MWTDSVVAGVVDQSTPPWRLRDHKGTVSLVHRVADAILVALGLWLACAFTAAEVSVALISAGLIGTGLFYFLAEIKDLYRPWRTESARVEVWLVLETWLLVAGISLTAIYVQQDAAEYPPDTMLYWLVTTPLLLAAWRWSARSALHYARAHGLNTRRLAIAGGGDLAQHVARTIEDKPWMGLDLLGLFDDEQSDDEQEVEHEPNGSPRGSRSLSTLVDLARRGDVDVIYIALRPGHKERESEALLRSLGDSTASVYLVQDRRARVADGSQGSRQILPNLWRIDVLQRRRLDLGGIQAVSLYETPFDGPDGWLKRLEDIAISSIALVLLALPMLLIAVGVKLSGPGPVFFKQRRYGLDGRQIMVWKFRSMSVCEDGGKVKQARKNDSRITPFGAFLRRTSLDELPQFVNVLQGSMSIVGPRPHAVAHNEQYRAIIGGYMLRHKVKPGITGWAQVNGWRGETDSVDKMGRRVDFDLAYIRNWSIWLDIWIVVLTFFKGFVHKNAY